MSRKLKKETTEYFRLLHNLGAQALIVHSQANADADKYFRQGNSVSGWAAIRIAREFGDAAATIAGLSSDSDTPRHIKRPSAIESAVGMVFSGPLLFARLTWLGFKTIFLARGYLSACIVDRMKARKAARKLKREGETATP